MEEIHFYETLVAPQLRVFLGEKGLSMAEADHRANMVKEELAKVTAQFENTNGFSSTVDLKGKEVKLDNFKTIEDLFETSQLEGQYYGLSSWLREGVKAKESALFVLKRLPRTSFQLDSDDEVLEWDEDEPVEQFATLQKCTEEDVIGTFTVKERAEYLMIEAKAAHIGKKIHESGVKKGKVLQLRDQLLNFQQHDLKEYPSGAGKDVYVVTNSPLYLSDYVSDTFMKLQELHRSLEAKLNWYKGKIKDELASLEMAANETFRKEARVLANTHRDEMAAFNARYQASRKATADRDSLLELRRLKAVKYVAKLRVIIPEDLEPLSNKIASLVKAEG